MENLYPATIGNVTRIEYGNQPVVTTAQLAQFYSCDERNIGDNFNNNKERFISGKHFFKLEGDALKQFKDCTENFGLVGNRAATLYLWTRRGAARHAKMLSTDRAWEVFEQLEDTYFARSDSRKISPASDFERGVELAKLAPHAKDTYAKSLIVAKAANLILGENFLPMPKPQMQLTLFGA